MSRQALDPLTVELTGSTLIEASAGTGKTYNIATLFLRLVLEQGLRIDQILVVTFTEAATAELRERIRDKLRLALDMLNGYQSDDQTMLRLLHSIQEDENRSRDRLERALASIDEAAIFTIHGFCSRMLREHAFESGAPFDSEMITDQQSLRQEIAQDFWASRCSGLHTLLLAYLSETGFTFDSALSIVKAVTEPNRETILPEPFPLQTCDFPERLDQLRDMWRADSHDIVDLLEGLVAQTRKGSFTPESVEAALEAMESALTSPLPSLKELGKKSPQSWCRKLAWPNLEKKTLKKNPPPEHRFFHACQDLVQSLETLPDLVQSLKWDLAQFARIKLSQRKAELDQQHFNDLLFGMRDALLGPQGKSLTARIRERFSATLIDEFQDTDPLQWTIFETLFAKRSEPLLLIGDPKQSIYGFRGADVFAYLQAAGATDRQYTLNTNYRADPGVIAGVNHLFERLAKRAEPFQVKEIEFQTVDPKEGRTDALDFANTLTAPVTLRFIPHQDEGLKKTWVADHLADLVAGDISDLLQSKTTLSEEGGLKSRPVRPGDVAVLVRKHRQAEAVAQSLRALSIPSVKVSQDSVFNSSEARDLAGVFKAIMEPAAQGLLKGALASDLIGMSAAQIAEQSDPAQAEVWEGWLVQFRDWRTAWHKHGFMRVFQSLLDHQRGGRPLRVRILSLPDGERRMTNLLHLAELLQAEASGQNRGPDSLLRWFEQQRSNTGIPPEAAQLRLESDANAVQLVTIHKAKGLEYPIVYCPWLWDGYLSRVGTHDPVVFHREADHQPLVHLGPDDRQRKAVKKIAEGENRAENMRMLYVALTRAKHRLCLYWGLFTSAAQSPLAYLLFCPETGETKELYSGLPKRSAQDLLDELHSLADQSSDSVSVVPVDMNLPSPGAYEPQQADPAKLLCPDAPSVPWPPLNTASFSRLSQPASSHTPQQQEGLDRDEEDEGPTVQGGLLPLADMPRGARAGDFFHDLYEHLDFTLPPKQDLKNLVAHRIIAYGFDLDRWLEPVVESVKACLKTPLDPSGLHLGQIGQGKKISEMEFYFPAENRGRTLAQAFSEHASDKLAPGYARSLRSLDMPRWHGFLKGFIDLTFEHQGRWYIVDYKSNHLGTRDSDYTLSRIQRSMAEHHYYLQYHLYAVAIRRYLKSRRGNYDHDQVFGGVFYLYLRGMSPEQGWQRGVFHDRPSEEMLLALEDVLGRTSS